MMRTFFWLLVAAAIWPALAEAQTGGAGLVAPEALRRSGLARMWFTQLGLDRGRGRVSGVAMHVSPTQSHRILQITHDGQRYVFSERDRDAFGKEIGLEVAKEQAGKKAEEIQKLAAAAGQTAAAAPTVETHVVPKITLYASSDRGLVQALDGETGQTLWTTQVGQPLYPTTTPAANDKYVALCNGSTIYVLLAKDGSLAWSRPATGIPGAGAALSEEYLFLPMVSGHIETILLEQPKLPVAVYKSFGRTMIQPVVSSNSVAWPTDSGNLYVALAHGPGIRFRMQATETIAAAPAFLAPDKVFTASLDGYLYCVNERKGNILWRFTTGEPITHSPVTFGETVFAISKRGNMFAIDAQSAAERWVASGIRSYLAASTKRLYCTDTQGDLAILDQTTGSRLATVLGVTSDMPFMNSQTDRILLVSSTGLVQCLRESELPWPVVHYLIEPPTKQSRPTPKTGAPKADDKSAPPKATDPFGSAADTPAASPPPAAADPFAAPAAAKPAAPAAGADPFAPK
jgi:outer membrane protein assembly factor BamB